MKRFCKNNVLCHLITDLAYVAIIAISFIDMLFIEDEAGELVGIETALVPLFIGACVLIYLAFILYQVFYLRLSGYQINENEVFCQRGVIFRRKSRLEYSKINAINKRQNIIQRIFGVAVLTLDSGATKTAGGAEIIIVEDTRTVDRLMSYFRSVKDGAAPVSSLNAEVCEKPQKLCTNYYEFTSKSKLLFSLINAVTALFFLVLSGAVLLLAFFAFSALRLVNADGILEYLITGAVAAVILLVGTSAVSFIGSIIYSFVSYYGFSVTKDNDSINISYGLFVRHENSFKLSKIKAVKVSQGLIKRLFGFASINLEVIGYTVDSSSENKGEEIGVLIPFCKMCEVNEILSELLPEFKIGERGESAKSFFPFISWFSLIFTLVFCAVSGVVFPLLFALSVGAAAIKATALAFALAYAAVFAIVSLNAVLKYKNSSLSVSGAKITVYGGGFIKRISVFDSKNLVAVERVSTPMRERAGISSFVLHIRANSETNEIHLDIRSSEIEGELVSLLRV